MDLLVGINNPFVTIVGANNELKTADGLDGFRKNSGQATRINTKLSIARGILSGELNETNARLVNLSKFPGNFMGDTKLMKLLWIWTELESKWVAFGPGQIENAISVARKAAEAA